MKRFNKILLVVIPIAGFLFSVYIFISMLNTEKRDLDERFKFESSIRINSVNHIIEFNQNILISLRNFYYGSNFVDRDEFGNFVSSFLDSHRGIQFIGWFPKINNHEIADYEYLYNDPRFNKTKIFSYENGNKVFLENKEVYYPLTYIEPFDEKYNYYGLDLSYFYNQNPIDLQFSTETGAIALLPSNLLNGDFAINNSIIMLLPVYQGNRSPILKNRTFDNIKGFVFSILSINDIIEKSMIHLEENDLRISIAQKKTDSISNNSRTSIEYIINSNENWIISSEANEVYDTKNRSSSPLLVFLLSVFITIIFTFYLFSNLGYTQNIEKEVKKRTKELSISRKRLDLAVEGGELGCWELNLVNGKITTNVKLAEMMGYKKNVIDSLETFFNMIHEDDRSEAVTKFKQHISGKSLFFESEHRIKTKNKHWLWILTKGQIVEKDSDGNPLQLSGVQIDISKMKNMQNILFRDATIDELTGLYNRRYFKNRLNELIEKSKRIKSNFTIAILDIDFFKKG